MTSFLALTIIIMLAWLVVRAGTSALQLTGMSQPMAQFQAASAFFGVGFTTREAEQVVNHPVRRRITLHLIVAGNIGLTSALATLLVTFMGSDDRGLGVTFAWLGLILLGTLSLGLLLRWPVVDRPLEKLIRNTLLKAGLGRIHNYDQLLNLSDGYCLEDRELPPDHPWIDKPIGQLRPADYGIIILGIYQPDGTFNGAPNKDTLITKGDVLLLYGRDQSIEEQFARDSK